MRLRKTGLILFFSAFLLMLGSGGWCFETREQVRLSVTSAPQEIKAGEKQVPFRIRIQNRGTEIIPAATVDEYYSKKKTTAQINFGFSSAKNLKESLNPQGGLLLPKVLESGRELEMEIPVNIPKDARGRMFLRVQPLMIQQVPEVFTWPIGEELIKEIRVQGLPWWERPKVLITWILLLEIVLLVTAVYYGFAAWRLVRK